MFIICIIIMIINLTNKNIILIMKMKYYFKISIFSFFFKFSNFLIFSIFQLIIIVINLINKKKFTLIEGRRVERDGRCVSSCGADRVAAASRSTGGADGRAVGGAGRRPGLTPAPPLDGVGRC